MWLSSGKTMLISKAWEQLTRFLIITAWLCDWCWFITADGLQEPAGLNPYAPTDWFMTTVQPPSPEVPEEAILKSKHWWCLWTLLDGPCGPNKCEDGGEGKRHVWEAVDLMKRSREKVVQLVLWGDSKDAVIKILTLTTGQMIDV